MKKSRYTHNTCPSLFVDHKFVHPFVKSATWGIVAMVTIRWDATRWATRWAAIRWITTRWITTRWARWATIRWLAIRWAVARFGLPSSEPLHSPWKDQVFWFHQGTEAPLKGMTIRTSSRRMQRYHDMNIKVPQPKMEICIDMLFIWGCRGGRGVGDLQVLVPGVTGVRTRSGKATNGRVRWAKWARWQQGGSGELCRVWLLSNILPGQISAQFVFWCSGWLIDWLISSRRSLLCSFYCHIASGGLGTRWHLGVFGLIWCRTVDQISMLYATYLPAWEHVPGDWQILWAKAMETTEPPVTESGLDGGCKTNASGIHLMHTSYQHV